MPKEILWVAVEAFSRRLRAVAEAKGGYRE